MGAGSGATDSRDGGTLHAVALRARVNNGNDGSAKFVSDNDLY